MNLLEALAEWRKVTFTDTNEQEPTIVELNRVACSLRDAYDANRKEMECGCIPGIVNPTCPKEHVQAAFVLKVRERPSFSVDLEDYQ